MSGAVGLVTGSAPFAGLPTNPAAQVLPALDGMVVSGIRVITRQTPVSLRSLPTLLPGLVAELSPVFVLSLGLALGAPLVRVEAMALNAAHFAIADNEGARPVGGGRFDPSGPLARAATWDAPRVVEALLAAGIPAALSLHAGTHLCNLTLYTMLGALEAQSRSVPCGFLHLPYLPEQVVWMMRARVADGDRARTTPIDLPSMGLDLQIAAVRTAVAELARQSLARSDHPASPEPEVSRP